VNIRETEINLSKTILLDIVKNRHYKAEDVASPYASFDPEPLLIKAVSPHVEPNSDGYIVLWDFISTTRARLERLNTKEAKLAFLVNETTWFHEVSHFHDYLCSSAGILAFAYDWIFATSVYQEVKEMRDHGRVPSDSFVKLASQKDPNATSIINLYGNLVMSRIVRFGDIDSITVDLSFRQYDIVWGRFDLPVSRLIPLSQVHRHIGVAGEI
jgi:hypothetical protein